MPNPWHYQDYDRSVSTLSLAPRNAPRREGEREGGGGEGRRLEEVGVVVEEHRVLHVERECESGPLMA